MEFSARVTSLQSDFDIQWGDTCRKRDIYTPFFTLSVQTVDQEYLPKLKTILLYSFIEFPANVYDQFDQNACLLNSKFSDLTIGSLLDIKGDIYPILLSNEGERFRHYRFAIIKPEAHPRKYDINGYLGADITEWFIEKTAIEDPSCLAHTVQLVVGWECCSIAANSPDQ